MSENSDAFEELFNRYKNQVLSYTTGLCKSRESAQDICQESFIKVFTKANTFDVNRKFSSWLWSIVRNTTYDHLRKKNEILLEDIKTHSDAPLELEDIDENIEAKLIEKSQREHIKKMLNQLPTSQREVLILQVFSDLSYEEIGKIVNKSPASVKSLLFRARKGLVSLMEKDNE